MKPALRLGLLLFVVFALGVVSTLAVTRIVVERTLRSLIDGPPEQLVDRPTLWVLKRRLGLDAAQEQRAREILAEHREERRAIQRELGPRLIAVRRGEVDELMPALDEKQRVLLKRLADDIEQRARAWMDLPSR